MQECQVKIPVRDSTLKPTQVIWSFFVYVKCYFSLLKQSSDTATLGSALIHNGSPERAVVRVWFGRYFLNKSQA